MTVIDVRRPAALTPARWVITRLERPTGFARISRHGAAVRVLVGDDGRPGRPGEPGYPVDRSESVVSALFDPDGRVVVETRSAPPALLVARSGTQLLPDTPGHQVPTRMADGDVLLLCSASALDSPPVGLVEILRSPAQQVLAMSHELMLAMILGDEPDGAAAVVMRAPSA
jgi:hypothetical protein